MVLVAPAVAGAERGLPHRAEIAIGDEARMDQATQRILEIARGVLTELELGDVLERVLSAAQELTGARYAALGVLSADKLELAQFHTRGIDENTRAMIGGLPRGRGVLGALIENGRPLRLDDVGEHPRSYGFPHGHPPMRSFLGVPILVKGEPYGNLYLTESGSGAFSQDDQDAAMMLADFAGVAIDHASRYTGARRDRDELARTVAALEATTQIARAVGGETDPTVVLELVAKRGRALVSARTLLIELGRGDQIEVAAAAGEAGADLVGRSFALESTVAAQAMRTLSIQRLDDELTRSRFEEHGAGRLGVGAEDGIVVPLVYRGHAHGVLVALDRLEGGPHFSEEDEMLLQSFAISAATSVATAESVVAERQRQRLAAAENERQRWARELHDDTLQSLSAVRIGLSTARRSGPGELPGAVTRAVEQLEESIHNLRALITDLRPAALDELGVSAAIEALAERAGRHAIAVDVSVELVDGGGDRARLADELEVAIYRIVQEALTNATRHGAADRAVVEISEAADVIRVVVRDNGVGFDPLATSDGFGLVGMRERAALVDGRLEVSSQPSGGTTVTATLPVRRRATDQHGDVGAAAGE
jgi:signal transduction histidine kinase